MNQDGELRPRRKILKWYYLLTGLIILSAVVTIAVLIFTRQPSGTLPYPISKLTAEQLGFDIYYPNQKLLPGGYTLNKGSFETTNQVLLYSVSYGSGKKIIFSDQAKPSNTQIQAFYTRNLPLNTTLQVNIGLATIGAVNLQTVVSIPTNTNAWLIATAPGNIKQRNLDQVIKSIEIAR
jgi:hypothetical protein